MTIFFARHFLLLERCVRRRYELQQFPLFGWRYLCTNGLDSNQQRQKIFVGRAVVDLLLLWHDNNVGIQVPRRHGEVEITTVK